MLKVDLHKQFEGAMKSPKALDDSSLASTAAPQSLLQHPWPFK